MLNFLHQLNEELLSEDHEKEMSEDELKSYLELLYKKCNAGTKKEFNEYLKKECDMEEADFEKCAEIVSKDKDRCDKVIHHLENLSNKVDESSLSFILNKGKEDEL